LLPPPPSQHENQQIEKLEAAVQTQEAVIEKLEEIVRTRSDELHAANARDDMVAVERQREAEMHTALLDSKSEVDAHCASLEGEVESMRAAQATLQRQKQDLGRQVERLKQQQQQFQSQPQGGGSGADTMNKSEAEMMFAVKDAKIEAMQAQMLNNALRFAAEIADLETVNMELTGQLQSRARGESSVPQTR
jgi:DNA repair exonuclease SbcCD ATPase subunit